LELASVVVLHNQRIASPHSQKMKRHGHCPILNISVSEASMILGLIKKAIENCIWSWVCITDVLAAFVGKEAVPQSQPHPKSER